MFARPKKNSDKIRMISDLRGVNACHQVPRHKAETWTSVLEVLQDRSLQFALVIDLKSWFHHLMLHRKMQRWMRMKIGEQAYQMIGMPFGWAMSPWWSNKLSKPIRRWLTAQNWPYTWWVDDILLLGTTEQEVTHRAVKLINLLTELGIQVNREKSMTQPSQVVEYLGHKINLKDNRLHPTMDKARQLHQTTRKLLQGTKFQPLQLASLAGGLIDAARSNVKLLGYPQILMRMAGKGVSQNMTRLQRWHHKACWQKWTTKPPQFQSILKIVAAALPRPIPRPFRPSNAHALALRTEASDEAWGGALSREPGSWGHAPRTGPRPTCTCTSRQKKPWHLRTH